MATLEEEASANKKQKVVQDRAHSIDATIIKRMKTHKRMDFNELLSEVLQALSMFQPQPKFIKQRIEKLIADEFLARDTEDKSMLVYLPWSTMKISDTSNIILVLLYATKSYILPPHLKQMKQKN